MVWYAFSINAGRPRHNSLKTCVYTLYKIYYIFRFVDCVTRVSWSTLITAYMYYSCTKIKMAGRPPGPIDLVPNVNVMPPAAVLAEHILLVDLIPCLDCTIGCIMFLAERGLLRNTCTCSNINCVGHNVHRCCCVREGGIDDYKWKCSNCRRKKTVRYGSFFERSKLHLRKLILFIYLWSSDMPQHEIKQQTGTGSDHTAMDWCNYRCEIYSTLCTMNATAT